MHVRPTTNSALLRIRLTPKGGKDDLMKVEAETLHVRVAAPPIDGAANQALISLLSKTLGVARSRISIASGHSSRDKSVRVDGISSDELRIRLEAALRQL